MVVDGVTKTENAANEPEKGRTRRVLAVEEAALDATRRGGRARAFGQLGVEVDEGREAGARAGGLHIYFGQIVMNSSRISKY